MPAEELKNFVTSLEGFKTPKKEILAILKEKALIQRAGSVKGRKDLIDLVSLFSLDNFDWEEYSRVLDRYELKELGLNVHKISRFKKQVLPLI